MQLMIKKFQDNKKFSLLFILISIMVFIILLKKDALTQRYDAYKIANFNPYKNYADAISCKCNSFDRIVQTPYLKIFKAENREDESTVYSILNTEEDKSYSLFLKFNRNACSNLQLNAGDIISARGHITVENDNELYIEPLQGYVEYQGRKYCQQ